MTGSRGVEGDVGCDHDDEDQAGEAVDSRVIDGSAEDVDEWVSGGVGESIVYALDGKKVGDQEYDRHDTVANVTPEDGDGNIATCISDFFGHVCCCIGSCSCQ